MRVSKVWGEDMILQSVHLMQKYSARAMNFVAVFIITREALESTTKNFPRAYRIIRKKALHLATRRAFVLEAQRRRDIMVAL